MPMVGIVRVLVLLTKPALSCAYALLPAEHSAVLVMTNRQATKDLRFVAFHSGTPVMSLRVLSRSCQEGGWPS